MLRIVSDEEIAPGVAGARERCDQRDEHDERAIRVVMLADGTWEELVECTGCGRWRRLLTAPA